MWRLARTALAAATLSLVAMGAHAQEVLIRNATVHTATAFGADGVYINTAANSSQAFVQEILYSFSPDSDYDDNANFGFRLVSVFDGTAYDAAGASANYGTGGSLRLDLVSVSVVPTTAAVPEPATNALMLGAGALAAVVYRRRRRRMAAPVVAR